MRMAPIQMRPSAIAATRGRMAASNVTRYSGTCGTMVQLHVEAKAFRRPGGLHTQRHWIELDLPHPARPPPAWCETLSGLAGLAGWYRSNDIVGASQDA